MPKPKFRLKLLRAIIHYLQEEGPATVPVIAGDLGRRDQLILSYLQHYDKTFEKVDGQWANTRWRTTVTVTQRGYDPDHRTK